MRCSPDHLRAAALLAALALPGAAGANDLCADCHAGQREARLRDPATELRASVHAGDAIGCAACHGGRRGEPTVRAHDRAAGFEPRPTGEAVAERCGGCHADARFIRRAGADLQVDQLALFRGDPHGRALTAGRTRAATCVSCHGAHAVRPAADVRAQVHPRNVAQTCAACHADPARLGGARLPTDQERRWRQSVHGRALIERGNARAPTCNDCHGDHGEYQETGGAADACRRCHEEEAARFDRSPHAAAYRRLGFAGCAACHGAHDVRESAAAALGADAAVCGRCHATGQRAWDIARRLAALKADALRAADRAAAAVRRAERAGLVVPGAAAQLDEAATARVRLDVALHTLDEPTIAAAAREVTRAATRAERLARDAGDRRERHRLGWLASLPLLWLLFALLLLKVRDVDRRGGAG